jgi:hypothetical protein
LAATKIRAQIQRFRDFGVSKSIGLSPQKRNYRLLYLLQSRFGLLSLVHDGLLSAMKALVSSVDRMVASNSALVSPRLAEPAALTSASRDYS